MSIQTVPFPLCRHIKTDGLTCKSPALKISAFCHHHRKLHRTRPQTINPHQALSTHFRSPLGDRESIQRAVSLIFQGLASGRLETRTAGRMIYMVQLATTQLNRTSLE